MARAGIGNLETPQHERAAGELRCQQSHRFSPRFVGNSQVYRPYPNLRHDHLSRRTSATPPIIAGTVHAQKRLSHGLTSDASTLMRRASTAAGVGQRLVASNLYKGPSSFDRRHRYVGNFSYELPIGKGRMLLNRGGVLNAVLGGYTLVVDSTIFTAATPSRGVSPTARTATCPASSESAAGRI